MHHLGSPWEPSSSTRARTERPGSSKSASAVYLRTSIRHRGRAVVSPSVKSSDIACLRVWYTSTPSKTCPRLRNPCSGTRGWRRSRCFSGCV